MKDMTLIYVQDGNKTLFLKRYQKTKDEISVGKYLGVGGKVDKEDKSIEDAAMREMLEETNLTANNLIKKGTVKFLGQRKYDVTAHVYICTDFDGTLKGDEREGSLEWVNNDDIDSLNVWEGDRLFLPKLFEDGEFDLTLVYKDGTLVQSKFL